LGCHEHDYDTVLNVNLKATIFCTPSFCEASYASQGWRQGDQHQFGTRRAAVPHFAPIALARAAIKMLAEFISIELARWASPSTLSLLALSKTPITRNSDDPVKLKSRAWKIFR